MGNVCQGQHNVSQNKQFNPIKFSFKRIHPISLPPNYEQSLDNIKEVINYVDARQNIGLKWYSAAPYDLYLFGNVKNQKPIGQCLFYIKSFGIEEQLPVMICTVIGEDQKLCKNTLLLYSDRSYYFGEIESHNLEQAPKANGKGMLVTREFIYDGDFKNGLPHGYGKFKTKSGELTGQFQDGQPHGKCIQRTKKGLFIGELIASFRKNGKLITANNDIEFINEEYPVDPSSGHTMVQL